MADNELKEGKGVLILSAPYYPEIVAKLEQGVKLALGDLQLPNDLKSVSVAGALELPLALSLIAQRCKDDIAQGELGVVVLGCLLRGETEHFSLICNEVFSGLQKVALEHSIPLGTGVLACDNEAQAFARAEKMGMQAYKACIRLMLVRQKLWEAQ